MTNGKQVRPHLATLVGGGTKPGELLGLQLIATPRKVTLLFKQPVVHVTLNPDSARRLAGRIVEATDVAELSEQENKCDQEPSKGAKD